MARIRRLPKTTLEAGDRTPWGPAQEVDRLGDGVYAVGTASHGGLRMFRTAQAAIPADVRRTFREGAGWAEEDCEQYIAAVLLHDRGVITTDNLSAAPERVCEAALRIAARYESYGAARPHLEAVKKRLAAGGGDTAEAGTATG